MRDDASDTLREIRGGAAGDGNRPARAASGKSRLPGAQELAERAQVVSRLGRECIPMKAGAQSEMDGVVLGASGTGATVFKAR